MDTFGGSIAFNLLDAVARVLIRCLIIGMTFLIILNVCHFMGYSEPLMQMQSKFFELSVENIALIWFVLLGITKLSLFVLFLLPYICIKLVLRQTSEY